MRLNGVGVESGSRNDRKATQKEQKNGRHSRRIKRFSDSGIKDFASFRESEFVANLGGSRANRPSNDWGAGYIKPANGAGKYAECYLPDLLGTRKFKFLADLCRPTRCDKIVTPTQRFNIYVGKNSS